MRFKAFVFIDPNWTSKVFFAAYEYFDGDYKKFLSLFSYGWKFISEFQLIESKDENWSTIVTKGFSFNNRPMINIHDANQNIIEMIHQWKCFCENSDPSLKESLLCNLTKIDETMTQLSIKDIRKKILSLSLLPNHKDPIVVDDCIIFSEVDSDSFDSIGLQATFWWNARTICLNSLFARSDIYLCLSEKYQVNSLILAQPIKNNGYGFLKLKSKIPSDLITVEEVTKTLKDGFPDFDFLVKNF